MSQRRTLTLAEEQRQLLLQHRNHDPRPFVRERCAALLKIADGHVPYQVAGTGLLRPRDPDTIYAWLNRFQSEGLAGLLNHQHGGSRRRSL